MACSRTRGSISVHSVIFHDLEGPSDDWGEGKTARQATRPPVRERRFRKDGSSGDSPSRGVDEA